MSMPEVRTVPIMPAAPPAAAAGAKPALVLRSSEFRRGREKSWQELETLVAKVERNGVGSLDFEELQRLPTLYRSVMSALSVARAIALDRHLLLYLENLCLRAFLVVYGPRQSLGEGIRDFLVHDFPAAVRASGVPILLAFLATAVGMAAGFMLTLQDMSWLTAIIPQGLNSLLTPTSTRDDLLRRELFAPWPGFTESFIVFANALFRHNTMVGLMAFGLGIAAGVPTLILMVYNGLVIGAAAGLHHDRGLLVDFIGWISIHGVTELGAIILCGAGGLVIARHELFPGRYTRVDNIAIRGRTAAHLAVGAVIMFFIAGFIEGGLRQLVADTTGRFAVAGVTAALWLGYFLFAGRGAVR
jgi:uncharacterized membrane protein SpoIIM required for sporulation